MYIILAIVCFGFHLIVSAALLSVKTQHDHLLVSWNPVQSPPKQWTITYNVIGTAYHSVLKVPGNRTSATINTMDFPGALYMIKLFASYNGKEMNTGTIFGRSDCSKHTETTIGSTYSFESFGYPGGLTSGTICTWTFTGSRDTWFRFEIEDFDIGNSSCNSYLMVGKEKICGNESVNGTVLENQPSFVIRLAYRDSGANRGVKFHVSAIHILLQPSNVTAINIGNSIAVVWNQPSYHPQNFTYVLRISHFPFNSHVDFALDGDVTKYLYHVTNHVGQDFSMELQSVSEDLASAFTDPVFVSTSCDRDIFVKATENTAVLSEQYPHSYLPKLSCNFRFQTEANFYMLIQTHDIDIGRGQMCDKTYLEIENLGKFCADTPAPPRLVVQQPSVTMVFRTDDIVNGKGINITIVSVAKPPAVLNGVVATSDDISIHVAWQLPSSQQVYLKGYTIQYFIAPSTPGATLTVDKHVHNITINTQSQPGRLYAMRIAAFTDGGVGNFSHPFYMRAGCGHRFHLLRYNTVVIKSPSNMNGFYEPDTLCQWIVKTDSPLWIRVTINKSMIEDSVNCSKDYVEVTGVGRLCGLLERSTAVIKETDVAITFRSNYQNESKGFSVLVEAVGPTPGQPREVGVSQSGYGVVIKWLPPTSHRRFLTGFLIHFYFYGEKNNTKHRVGANTNDHVLDTTPYPGRLLAIWLQADGDVEDSNATKTVFIRTGCGYSTDVSGPTYITSPYYENNHYANIQCLWTLKVQKHYHLKVDFIRINLNNNIQTCDNYILVNNESRYCDDSYENRPVLFNATIALTLEWHTSSFGKGTYFSLSVEPIADVHYETVKSGPVSSLSVRIFSSTPLLMTSYIGTLLVSTLMATSALSSHEVITTKVISQEANILQTSSPSHDITELHKSEMLQTTEITDKTQTHSKRNFVARQPVSMLNSEAKVLNNNKFSSPNPGFTSDHEISPTRASFFVVKTEKEMTVLLTNSIKCISSYTNSTAIATPRHAQASPWKTGASVSKENVNTKALQTAVSKINVLDFNYTKPSLLLITFSKAIAVKGEHKYNTLLPSGSPSFSVSSSWVRSVLTKEASKTMRTSRYLETKIDVTPTKVLGQDGRKASNGTERIHFLLLSIYICIIIIYFAI